MNRLAADAVYDSSEFNRWLETAKPGDVYVYEMGAVTLQAAEEDGESAEGDTLAASGSAGESSSRTGKSSTASTKARSAFASGHGASSTPGPLSAWGTSSWTVQKATINSSATTESFIGTADEPTKSQKSISIGTPSTSSDDLSSSRSTTNASSSIRATSSRPESANITAPNPTASNIERRRECYSSSQSLQTNVDWTGTWWDVWFKLSPCQWCTTDDCFLGFDWTHTSTWRVQGDFDYAGADAAEQAINANSGMNKGFQWGRAFATGTRYTCGASSEDAVSVWRQNRFGWSTIAQRTVYHSRCPGVPNGYSEWRFSHIDWAIAGSDGYQLGCSYRASAHC